MGGTTAYLQPILQQEILPQWSPPLVGGTTRDTGGEQIFGPLPQWSPPLVGGTTRGA